MRHPFPPCFDSGSRILVLGSFPSVKSREQGFFYGHPQNRFWMVTAAVFSCEVPVTIEDKRAFLKQNHIALWDCIASCDIIGSQDSSISNASVNDLSVIIQNSIVKRIFVNGKKALEMYDKYLREQYGDAVYLPSTSPANAAWTKDKLIARWKQLADE